MSITLETSGLFLVVCRGAGNKFLWTHDHAMTVRDMISEAFDQRWETLEIYLVDADYKLTAAIDITAQVAHCIAQRLGEMAPEYPGWPKCWVEFCDRFPTVQSTMESHRCEWAGQMPVHDFYNREEIDA